MSLLPLALALALTAQAPAPPPADTAGTRLVIVTFERRAGAYFRAHPEEYGPFLAARRQEVLDLLFGPGEARVRPGDFVALMADGADPAFPASTGLGAASSPADVAARLRPMLSLPGAVPGPDARVWLRQLSDTVGRAQTDAALRTLITCPLAGERGACDEAASLAPGATSGFSRPLLTFPVQYMLAAEALRARAGVQPDQVHWIWVQVGERFNEINSLVPEIRRDFHPPEAARAVLAFRDSTLRALEFRFVSETAPPAGGGVTVWQISSAGLHALATPGAAPLAFRDAGRGGALPALSQAATSFHRPAPPLLEHAGLRIVLAGGAAAESGGLLRVQGEAACGPAAGGGPPAAALEWVLDADRRGAALSPRSADALARLARRCLPPQGFLSRLRRELAGDRSATGLRVAVRAQIAPPARADGLAAPPLLAAATLERAWHHAPLRTAEAVLHLLGLVAFVTALGALVWWVRFRLSPTELDVELRTPDGAPVTADTVVALTPGQGAPPPELEVAVVHRGGPARPWTHHLALGARALQAEVPVLPGADATRLVVLASGSASTADEGGIRLRGEGSARGDAAARLALSLPDDVLDLDRAPVGIPLRSGVEVTVEVTSPTARVRGRRRTFYVPCAITVGRAPATEPGLRVEPLQVYLYRGLRPDPGAPADTGTRVGALRIAHRADPRAGARPYGVRLRLALSARLRDEAGADAGPVRAALGSRALPVQHTLEVEVDDPEREVPLYLWPADAAALGARSGTVEVEVSGSWEEMDAGRRPEPRPLSPVREGVAWYPVETLYGVAVDFGTSATRLAFLREGMPAERTMGIAVPVELVPEAAHGDGAAAPVELSGELGSGVAVDTGGRLRAAGASALVRGRGWTVLPSLKQALMDPAAGPREWQAARQVIDRLGDWVEREGSGGALLELCRWRDGAWQMQPHVVPPPFRYLLLATVPDTFDRRAQARFATCFERWKGRVSVLPLREAEAVVFGALMREPEHQPARTLVVDVGAGTVDYAAVRAAFDDRGVLTELRVEGLAVSRAAGNAYDEALARHLGQLSRPPRSWRETKERWYLDPEGSGRPLSPEAAAFLESPRLRQHLDAAVSAPLDALLGRLAHQEAWTGARFDRVILSGRGSLAAGWKARLVEELHARRRVPDPSGEGWLSWLEPGAPDVRADRLKAAVAEGALALISHNQARIQTSRDILRDHVVLVAQSGAGRYRSELVAAAGEVLSPGGIARRVRVGDWLDAKLVLSSHLPGDAGSGAPADLLWRKGVAGEIDDGAGPAPMVRLGADIPIVGRPADATHGVVLVEQGGSVSFAWEAF